LYSAEQSFWNMPRCYARLRVLGVGAVVLLLVLTAATFGADHYLVSASASLPYREITLDHLLSRILNHFLVIVNSLEHTSVIAIRLV